MLVWIKEKQDFNVYGQAQKEIDYVKFKTSVL